MYPILFQFKWLGKDIIIGTYGVIMFIAIATGIFLALRIASHQRFPSKDVFSYCMILVSGGLAGSILAGFFIFLPERIAYGFWDYPVTHISWGALLGGLTAAVIIKKVWSLNLLNLTDIFTPGYLLAFGIGRIGCFFGGCCYGITTSSSCGITFTHPVAPASVMVQPLFPTQLISAAFLITTALVLTFFVSRRKTPGLIFVSMFIIYPIFRFNIEFMRADPRKFIFWLSDGQIISIGLLFTGLIGLIYIMKNRGELQKDIKYLHSTDKPEII